MRGRNVLGVGGGSWWRAIAGVRYLELAGGGGAGPAQIDVGEANDGESGGWGGSGAARGGLNRRGVCGVCPARWFVAGGVTCDAAAGLAS